MARNQLTKSYNSTALYFGKSHHASPMIHRLRYMSSLRFPPALQPPACLQHAIMAIGACTHPEYASMATQIYRRSRALAEMDEMEVCQMSTYPSTYLSPDADRYLQDQTESLVRVSHAQCWLLIAYFEAQNGMLSRACISLGRSIRLAQILNLHQLDRGEHGPSLFTHFLPPQDWTELEERRRTWWLIYVADRLVFATSGLPAVVDDRQVGNNPPSRPLTLWTLTVSYTGAHFAPSIRGGF